MRARRWALVLCFFLFAVGSGPAMAEVSAPGTAGPRSTSATTRSYSAMNASLPVADGWLGRIFGPLRSVFNNRTRMVQMATVGMAIGLFIMFSMGKNK
jgi:hypothetical protein